MSAAHLFAGRPRARLAVRWSAFALAVLCTAVLVLAGTLRFTVVSAGYYRSLLDDTDAYDRLYDQVLVDPEASGVTRDLLARLPVPANVVTANVKNVLPPNTAEAIGDQVIGQSVGYLRGDRDDLRLTVDIEPVLRNVGSFANLYFGDLVASLQKKAAPDYRAFREDLDQAVDSIAAGRAPEDLPSLSLTGSQQEDAADVVLKAVPRADRAELRPHVEAALGSGDVATALAEVGPAALAGKGSSAIKEIRAKADGDSWNITADLDGARDRLGPVREARSYTRLVLGPAQTAAGAVGLLALAALWLTGPAAAHRRLQLVGGSLAGGGALAAGLVGVVRLALGDRPLRPGSGWPGSVARLVSDLQRTALARLVDTALLTALIPVAAGVLLLAGGWGWQRWATRHHRHPGLLPARVKWTAAGAVAAALAGAVFAPAAFGGEAKERCQGSAALCALRYDEVAQLAAHNAMSNTEARFVSPLQDASITGQLNNGARALLIDTHTWEQPDQIAARLKLSEFTPAMQRQILRVIDKGAPARPGLWLCHAVCRGGATPLVPELERIGDWLEQNPREVVTLVIQDGISGRDTDRALRAAGLRDLLYTPDDDPDAQWPTLGEMIDKGERLVVFAESRDGPAPYYRNFYRYGMETPFAFRSPADMTCAPNRGGTGKRLFLMNHFITNGGGSRLAAGRINARDAVLARAHRCEKERGHPVNLVAVDYASIGDAKGAVDVLNGERVAAKGG